VYNLERYMVGCRLELLGAGLSVPVHDAKLLYEKLREVLNDRSFSRNAERFRDRYRGDAIDSQLDRVMPDISESRT
jgi:UDP:flavonoid glycosyltransferase YjiC (YdhE family)